MYCYWLQVKVILIISIYLKNIHIQINKLVITNIIIVINDNVLYYDKYNI